MLGGKGECLRGYVIREGKKDYKPPKYISFMKSLTSCADSTCGMTIPAQPASSAVVRLSSSCFGTLQITIDFPSEWCWAAWMQLCRIISISSPIARFACRLVKKTHSCSVKRLNMPCSTSIQMKSGFVLAINLVTKVLGMPCATPIRLLLESAWASLSACRRFAGWVSMDAR